MKTFHHICSAVLFFFALQTATCMQCEFGGNRNFLDKINIVEPKECPSLIDGSDKEFCCLDDNNYTYCCNAQQFFFNKNGILMIIVGSLIIGFLLSCCLCCFCCPCCCWYKRRHGGIVYATVPHNTMQVLVTPPQVQQYPLTPAQPGFSTPPGQEPPPYSFTSDQLKHN